MGFFTDLKEDLAMAVNELMPEETEDVIRTAENDSAKDIQAEVAEEEIQVTAEDFELDKMLENLDALDLQMPEEIMEEEVIEALSESEAEETMNEDEDEAELEESVTEEMPEPESEEMVAEDVLEPESEEMVTEELSNYEFEEVRSKDLMESVVEEESLVKEEMLDIDKILEAEVDELIHSESTDITEVIDEESSELYQIEESTILAATEQEEKNTQDEGTEKKMETMTNRVASDETAVITQGMIITGDIISEGSVDVIGTINGNIDILGKLNVTGAIQGNSKAAEIFADNAKINGEIIAEGSVKIGQSSIIIGNITASSAVIAGAVKGDIDVQGPVILDTSAIVMGNIKSKSVQINNGAVIEGMCSQCYADVNPTSFFDELKKNK